MTRRKRNPWHGIHDGKEFLYDVKHPLQFLADSYDGLRGRNQLDPGIRALAVAMCCAGCLYLVAGILALVLA